MISNNKLISIKKKSLKHHYVLHLDSLQSDSQRIIPQISNAENSDGIY